MHAPAAAPDQAAAQVPDVYLQTHGITSTDPAQNPSFHGWNHVHVWYCSSDSHLGDTSTGVLPQLVHASRMPT